MLDLLSPLKKFHKISSVRIDDVHSKLHYQVTASLLFAFSILLTGRQYLGDPIDCLVDEIPPGMMDTYCWIQSTFTVPNASDKNIYPGVRPFVDGKEEVQSHKYYQWVFLVLGFQALLFYVPHYLWKWCETKRMSMLAKEANVDALVKYFFDRDQNQSRYFVQYVICEILNLVNVIGQIFFMDFFLNGEFLNYGSEVLNFPSGSSSQRLHPMARVFPKIAKCTFKKFGASGTLQAFDGLCVLPLNLLNEKIYVFLWFWFITLSVVSALSLIYRGYVWSSSSQRRQRINARCLELADESDVAIIVDNLDVGEWFIFNQLGKNVDPLVYTELIRQLSKCYWNKKG